MTDKTPSEGVFHFAGLPQSDPREIVIESQGFVSRMIQNPQELLAAQRLRYASFFEGDTPFLGSRPAPTQEELPIVADSFDDYSDIMIVIDKNNQSPSPTLIELGTVVGTYRFLRQAQAKRHGGFVCDDEFDVNQMLSLNANTNFVELSRAAVASNYRDRATILLMWRFIVSYCRACAIDVMFGAASFSTTDPDEISTQLTLLAREYCAPAQWRITAQPSRYVAIDRLPADEPIDEAATMRMMPPLLRGYLGVGGYIGDGAVIDYDFGTVDVAIIVPVSRVTKSVINFFLRS